MRLMIDGNPVRIKRLGPRSGGRALLFVPGAGLSAEAWGGIPRHFANHGSPTLTVDLPGHGASGGAALATIAEMAGWLDRLLEILALDRPILVGHSMGAMVVLHATAIPIRPVGGLVLLGAGLRMPVNERLLRSAASAPTEAAALIARWAFRDGRTAGRNPSPTPSMRMAARRLLQQAGPGVLAADLEACDAYRDAAAMAERITGPVLLVIGRNDRMTPPDAGMALAAHIADTRVVELPCGHMAMTEAPRPVQAAIMKFSKEGSA